MDTPALLKLLGDETRLRLLRLVGREALNVSELTGILGVAQSGVSRHLGLLREAGLVAEQKSGTFTWYRLAPSLQEPGAPNAGLWSWLSAELERQTPATREDDVRLEEVRRLRQESFRQHGGGDERRQLVPGRSWAAWARALGLLMPPLEVADLGCGEGYLTIETALWAKHVTAVDRSNEVLARAKELARKRKVRNITWRRGTIEKAPLEDASVDLVLLSQALHHVEKPDAALAEARRVLRPGGRLLVLDLREHDERWVADKLGDQWMGFSDHTLQALLEQAGFTHVEVRIGARQPGDPFVVLIARGERAAGKDSRSPFRRSLPKRTPGVFSGGSFADKEPT